MRFELYRDKKGEWRWRLRARNGRIIADSGQGYRHKGDCRRMAAKVAKLQGYITRPATFGALRYDELDGCYTLPDGAPHSAAKSYGTKV